MPNIHTHSRLWKLHQQHLAHGLHSSSAVPSISDVFISSTLGEVFLHQVLILLEGSKLLRSLIVNPCHVIKEKSHSFLLRNLMHGLAWKRSLFVDLRVQSPWFGIYALIFM